ncbi:nitroreductase family protein [Methylocaldum sp.]|uniref:nitroreductase family protein n=1 Tax=Methylocaldum sp. TaxID=1969727 RepID=UPI002D301336|nr:nitroreductase family protein [Methylocaldum sp.]HYE37203.1 nitroreductase family protein [Methylocaldum sp.]
MDARIETGGYSGPDGGATVNAAADRLARVLAYHERTKHRLERYAAGPETLDWDSQPDPFRCFEGAPKVRLPLAADRLTTSFGALFEPGVVAPQPLSLETIGILLELSLGLSAWKEYGPDRWALRCNPSSGNLHPTEGYIICRAVPELPDGVYHYVSRDHVLERRCRSAAEQLPATAPRLLLALTSIHWREAWKYGERAFRYCQLDTGHALGALRYAAAALGWSLRWVSQAGFSELSAGLGLDRHEDFSGAEREEPELLLELITDPLASESDPTDLVSAGNAWSGRANVLDPHPMYRWPVIDEVAEATRAPGMDPEPGATAVYPPRPGLSAEPAAALIRQRRSAQHFDRRQVLSAADFYGLLDALLPRPVPPWDAWSFTPRLHPVFFVHRVEGLPPGLYILPRRAAIEPSLKAALHGEFNWIKPAGCPEHLPFFRLSEADCGKLSRTVNCHQAIGADGAFALGMLAEFEATLTAAPWRYRQLYWEAGLLGQVLYLEAEAIGIRGTGIGCYFDDVFHELLGLSGRAFQSQTVASGAPNRPFQSLYHFTVGFPLTDSRILTLPPYGGRNSD